MLLEGVRLLPTGEVGTLLQELPDVEYHEVSFGGDVAIIFSFGFRR